MLFTSVNSRPTVVEKCKSRKQETSLTQIEFEFLIGYKCCPAQNTEKTGKKLNDYISVFLET